jgi:DNA repair protein SbcD/Mre11
MNSSQPIPPKIKGAFRVVHTADWHLGKTLSDLDRTEDFRRFLATLVDGLAKAEADALIVAGDVFDGATPPKAAERLYYDFLSSLYRKTNCVAVITAGNHDSPLQLEAPKTLLGVLRAWITASVPSDRAEWLIPLPSPENPSLVVAAVPFLRERDLRTGRLGQSAEEIERDLREGIRLRYREVADAAAEWVRRGVPLLATGHLTALGAALSPADGEREIHVGGLGRVGADTFPGEFAYVALGHLHRAQSVGGRDHIRYSGSPLVLSFGEAGDAKTLRLVDFKDGALITNQAIPVPQPRSLSVLRAPAAELKAALAAFEPPESELTPWVEVVVEGGSPGADLHREVQKAAEGRRFQVIKVTAENEATHLALELDERAEAEAENLLADPKAVFQRRLDAEPELDAPSRAALTTAFAQLYGRYLEESAQKL